VRGARWFGWALALWAVAAVAAPEPMTLKEVAMMLRSGIPKDEIIADAARRRLLEPIDAAGEAVLKGSGATEGFIAALKAGQFTVDPETAARVIREREERARAARLQGLPARPAEPVGEPGRGPQAIISTGSPEMYQRVWERLVRLRLGQWVAVPELELRKVRYFVFYFSAGWCGPCRAFTPQLAEYYRARKAEHPEFELIWVSRDRSAFNAKAYAKEFEMPWPAIRYDAIDESILRYASSGIPYLVIVRDTGEPILPQDHDGKHIAPDRVLKALDKLLERPPTAPR
jgi:thiol-disulfide isomerase/thioredoxin